MGDVLEIFQFYCGLGQFVGLAQAAQAEPGAEAEQADVEARDYHECHSRSDW